MRTKNGGTPAKEGFYFNLNNKEIVTLEKEGMLPGTDIIHYVRIPLLAMLIGGPLIGLLYVIFLPFISFVMVLSVALQKTKAVLQTIGRKPAKSVIAESKAGVTYLALASQWKNEAAAKPEQNILKPAQKNDLLIVLERDIPRQHKEGLQ
jgi:hypothetical protein